MSLFTKNEIDVDIDNIEIGFVCKRDENANSSSCLRKIVFARNTGYMCSPNKCVISVNGQSGDVLFKDGMDLCNKIENQPIIYPVILDQKDVNSNLDIFISDPINTGCILRFIGFNERLNSKDLRLIRRVLLEPDFPILRQKTQIYFPEFQRIEFSKLSETMEKILIFKEYGNTSEITHEERKIFKQKLKTNR